MIYIRKEYNARLRQHEEVVYDEFEYKEFFKEFKEDKIEDLKDEIEMIREEIKEADRWDKESLRLERDLLKDELKDVKSMTFEEFIKIYDEDLIRIEESLEIYEISEFEYNNPEWDAIRLFRD